jgi:hypothetical protein
MNDHRITLAMLIESRKHQEGKLPQIQASSAIEVKLQRGRRMKNKNREGRAHRSLAGDDGAAASVLREIRSHSNVAERGGGGGGVIDGNVGRRRASAPA